MIAVRATVYRNREGWYVYLRDATGPCAKLFTTRGHEVVGLRRIARRWGAWDACIWIQAVWTAEV